MAVSLDPWVSVPRSVLQYAAVALEASADNGDQYNAARIRHALSAEWEEKVRLERKRQIEELGYNAEHDDEHGMDHLLKLAYEYIRDGEYVKSAAVIQAARAKVQRDTYRGLVSTQSARPTRPRVTLHDGRELAGDCNG